MTVDRDKSRCTPQAHTPRRRSVLTDLESVQFFRRHCLVVIEETHMKIPVAKDFEWSVPGSNR